MQQNCDFGTLITNCVVYFFHMKRVVLLALLLCIPSFAGADVGFAKAALWLSQTDVVEGESVSIYTSLSNPENIRATGSVQFTDGVEKIGTVEAALAAGESRVVSVSWKPAAGAHTLRALFLDSEGKEIDAVSLSVSIAAKPKREQVRTSSLTASVEDSSGIQGKITDVSPAVAEVVNPALETTDSWREKGVEFLDSKIADSQATLDTLAAQKKALGVGSILGSSRASPDTQKESRSIAIKQVMHTLLLYLMEVLRFILASAAFFYPLVVILFFVALYKLYQRFRRPRYADI